MSGNNTKCPGCKNCCLKTTRYEEEGGFCSVCNTWMAPESSRQGIINARGIDEYLLIQFYDDTTDTLTHTWKEYQEIHYKENLVCEDDLPNDLDQFFGDDDK